jgi:hypothetical protein
MNYDSEIMGSGDTNVAIAGKLYVAMLLAGPDNLFGTVDDKLLNPGTASSPFLGGYAAQALGAWGVDTVSNTAWVVLPGTTQGQFAVVPEAASLTILGAAGAAVLMRRKRRV